jgi:hypothetical protein
VTLDDTYSQILDSITSNDIHKLKAIKILQLLVFSERPLHVNEVVDAIAVDTNRKPQFDEKRRMPIPQDVARYCKSLVTVSSSDTGSTSKEKNYADNLVLQLAHFSVKQYLISNRVHQTFSEVFQEAIARACIATTCTAYLLHLDRKRGEIQKFFPFAKYCARYWLEHAAARKGKEDEAHTLIMELFGRKEAFVTWLQLNKPDLEPKKLPSPIYYASLGGLQYEVKVLIDQGADVNTQGVFYGNALQAASDKGHKKIVQLLLKAGADVNAQGTMYGSALYTASLNGHKEIVQLLLEAGADVNTKCKNYGSTLQAAFYRGRRGRNEIIQLLLEAGADTTNLKDELGEDALSI